jgi:hypothetical protein
VTDTNIDLRDLVDQLTIPHTVPVEEYGRTLGHRDQQALLVKLRAARTANIGAGNNARAAHERSTLNIAASELYTAIQRRVKRWAIHADVPRHWTLHNHQPIDWTDPAQLLRAWHVRILASNLELDAYTDTLRGWTHTINDLVIDPPKRWTIAAPCPLCNQRYVLDPDGNQTDTLGVIERDPAHASITLCRNCAAVWAGIDGARALRIAIDDAAHVAS